MNFVLVKSSFDNKREALPCLRRGVRLPSSPLEVVRHEPLVVRGGHEEGRAHAVHQHQVLATGRGHGPALGGRGGQRGAGGRCQAREPAQGGHARAEEEGRRHGWKRGEGCVCVLRVKEPGDKISGPLAKTMPVLSLAEQICPIGFLFELTGQTIAKDELRDRPQATYADFVAKIS